MPHFPDIGLPVGEPDGWMGELQFHKLFFNAPSGTLIAVLRPRKMSEGVCRVFVRAVDEPMYRPVNLPDGADSIADIVVCGDAAVALAVVQAWQRERLPGTDAIGIDLLGVVSVGLPSGTTTMLAPVLGKPGSRRVWVSRLLGSENGAAYHAVIANEQEYEQGNHRVQYSVMNVDVASGGCSLICDLAMPFA
jgi:hypothetical protein